jgi:hypothetical protein
MHAGDPCHVRAVHTQRPRARASQSIDRVSWRPGSSVTVSITLAVEKARDDDGWPGTVTSGLQQDKLHTSVADVLRVDHADLPRKRRASQVAKRN